jgi:uncharacterized protein YktB (UPF0637 family)
MEDILASSFVFDFVLEIVTNAEMAYHNKIYENSKMQAYNMVLNANDAMENLLDDDYVFCLDGTMYSNVSKFLNHQCQGANLVDILVQIESNTKHIYHVCLCIPFS